MDHKSFGSKNNSYVYDSKLRQSFLSVLKDTKTYNSMMKMIIFNDHFNMMARS